MMISPLLLIRKRADSIFEVRVKAARLKTIDSMSGENE